MDLQNKPDSFVELYGKANPLPGARAKVPLLVVGDIEDVDSSVLCESLIVAEYIAELHQLSSVESGLRRTSPEDRAVMRLFTELCSSCFSYLPILRAKEEAQLESALDTFKSGLTDADAFLRKMGTGGIGDKGPFLFGNEFTLAECNAAPFVQRACAVLPSGIGNGQPVHPLELCDELGLDRLKCWMEAVLERPSVIKTGVPADKLVKNIEKMLERFATMEKKQ